MFSDLDEVFGSLEFEDSGFAHIAAFSHDDEGLRVQLRIRFDYTNLAAQVWELGCGKLRNFAISHGEIASIELVSSHPLLVPHTAKWVDLSFRGGSLPASAIVGELWEAHCEVTDGWFPFEAFFNRGLKMGDLLSIGSGILAEGPRPFLERYAKVLERHAVRVSWVAEREPSEWRDGGWVPERDGLQALVLGESYIIGRDWVDARRVS